MQTVRIVSLMAAAGLAWSLAAQAADGDRQPPAPPEPARQPPPSATSPSGTDRTDHSKEQERAVKPPTDASMGAVERKPEPVPDSGRNK